MKEKREKGKHLPCRIHTRLTQEKFDELTDLLKRSRSLHSKSELVRYILENRKIVTVNYDASLDKVMEELSTIRKELQAIGININQVTRQFHMQDSSEGRLIKALEITQLFQQTDLKITEIFSLIAKISETWCAK